MSYVQPVMRPEARGGGHVSIGLFAVVCLLVGIWAGFEMAAMTSLHAVQARMDDLFTQIEDLSSRLDTLQRALENFGAEVAPIDEAIGAVSNLPPGLFRLRMALAVYRSARAHGVDPMLVVAVGAVESSWQPDAVGRAGERGPLQVLPSTFGYLGMTGGTLEAQIEAGVRYLALVLERSRGDLRVAVARYNLGHNTPRKAALRKGRVYVRRVLRVLEQEALRNVAAQRQAERSV